MELSRNLPAVQTPAARRALVWGLCVTLFAVVLGIVQMKSEALSQWSRSSGLSFWELAGIAVMDSILVAAGSRGSNAFRAVARLAFCFVFAMAVLYGVLGTAVMLSKGGPDFGWGELVLGELIFVPTGVLQLVSLRAVPKHV